MDLNFDLRFTQEALSPLERDLLIGKQGALVASATEKILLETNCHLYEGHKPNPQAAYAQEMLKLTLDLCKKYNPRDVEAAMKKYFPGLF